MNLKHLLPGALAFAIAAILCPGARAADAAAQDQPSGNDQESTTLQRVEVRGRNQDDTRPEAQHIMKEVDGPLITVTKKTSITKLDNIPTVIDNTARPVCANSGTVLLRAAIAGAAQPELSRHRQSAGIGIRDRAAGRHSAGRRLDRFSDDLCRSRCRRRSSRCS